MTREPFDRIGGAPVRAFRDRYAAPFVGVSYDLAPQHIGIHPVHVRETPEIVGKEVLVTRDKSRAPPHRRPAFRVVMIQEIMRNAASVGRVGGVVFSSFDLEDPDASEVISDLEVGEVLYLNAALGRLPDAALRRPFFDATEGDVPGAAS